MELRLCFLLDLGKHRHDQDKGVEDRSRLEVHVGSWTYLHDCGRIYRIGTSDEFSGSSISDGTLVIASYAILGPQFMKKWVYVSGL